MIARLSRRTLSLAAVAGTLVVAAYLVFGNNDERRALRVLSELAAAVSSQPGDIEASRARRIEAALAERTTDSVLLSLPELGDIEGREELGELLTSIGLVPLELSIDASSVQLDAAGRRARAALTVTAIVRYPGEERRDTRSASVDLSRTKQGFRVSRIQITAKSRVEPEARP